MRQARVGQVAIVVLIAMLMLVVRLYRLQVVQAKEWADEARLSRLEVRTLPFRRGRILDRDGKVLAEDQVTYELDCNYREFRRGHPAGQLLEILALRGLQAGGLDEVLARAEAIGAEVLGWRAEELQQLPSRDRRDVCFYLRVLGGLPESAGVAVGTWADTGSGSFEAAFPGVRARFVERVEDARGAVARLERALAESAPEEAWLGELLPRLEEERRLLERRIRELSVDAALGRALPDPGAAATRELLRAGGEPADRLLATLDARWGPFEDLAALRATLIGEFETPRHGDAARAALLRHLESAARDDVEGLRRRFVARVHGDRTIHVERDLAYAPADLVVQDSVHYPGLYVQEAPSRHYPIDVAPHLIGRVGAMGEAEVEEFQRAREEYQELSRAFYRSQADERRYQDLRHRFLARQRRPGEASGASGVERAFESVLRGDRGYQQVVQGGEGGARPLEMVFEPPRHGQDVVLALDVDLQQEAIRALRRAYREAAAELHPGDDRWANDPERFRRVRAALESPRGAFVLLDLRGGGLPVLATVPGYTRAEFRTDFTRLAEDRRDTPLRQRALGGMADGPQTPYPGSTFKLLVAAAALEADPAAWVQTYVCEHVLHAPGGTRPLRCEGSHGRIGMREALMRSCNVYFYLCAQDLGYERIHALAERLGFGRPTGIELVPAVRDEETGEWRPGGSDWTLEAGANVLLPPDRHSVRDTMRLAIGQTRVVASPLQMARLFGWLATGELLAPRLVLEGGGAAPAAFQEDAPALPRAHRELFEDALCAVVEDPRGTAWDLLRPLQEFGVAGKTGTAQVGGDGLVHSWFAGYFPADEPRYAFAIFCENTGLHGGEIASDALFRFLESPVAAQLLEPRE